MFLICFLTDYDSLFFFQAEDGIRDSGKEQSGNATDNEEEHYSQSIETAAEFLAHDTTTAGDGDEDEDDFKDANKEYTSNPYGDNISMSTAFNNIDAQVNKGKKHTVKTKQTVGITANFNQDLLSSTFSAMPTHNPNLNLFSGFKTPKIGSSRWGNTKKFSYLPKTTSIDEKERYTEYNRNASEKYSEDEEPEFFNSNSKTSKDSFDKSKFGESAFYDMFENYYDPYPSWQLNAPINRKEIEKIFDELGDVFKFQKDNLKNMFDYLLRMLDSRGSRMSSLEALKSLHRDYIGGKQANFRKWYFASQMDLEDLVGFKNLKKNGHYKKASKNQQQNYQNNNMYQNNFDLTCAEEKWDSNILNLKCYDYVVQIALYLLCWGEAANVRFIPECLCFIYKCALDYFYFLKKDLESETNSDTLGKSPTKHIEIKDFLTHAICPIYEFYLTANYESTKNNTYIAKENSHSKTIGYDDINQFFWYRKNLEKISLSVTLNNEKCYLFDYEPHIRFLHLNRVNWKKCFYKTYKEKRTWLHVVTNFNRIWIIHLCVFWYYTAYNSKPFYTHNYRQQKNTQPTTQATYSIMALAGSLASLINILSVLGEFSFVPRKFPGAVSITKKIILLICIFLINTIPSVYIFGMLPLNYQSTFTLGLSLVQFIISIITVVYFSIVPLNNLFGFSYRNEKVRRKYLANLYFMSSVVNLKDKALLASIGLWITIFFLKFVESYFFLTLSLKDPLRELKIINLTSCTGTTGFSAVFCVRQTHLLVTMMLFTDMVLFFLDTYLWYIICSATFSVFRSFYIGVSIWTPWKNIFSRLPKRIYSKILYPENIDPQKAQFLVSQVWNCIIISMYREHLISIEHVKKLIYSSGDSVDANSVHKTTLKEPSFFISQDDRILETSLFKTEPEAQRRITFFAQSLSTPMPDSCAVNQMPTFTVLIPHYNENITLTLRKIIKEEDDGFSQLTLLEYLKGLHPTEWKYFIEDTKKLVEETEASVSSFSSSSSSSIMSGTTFLKKNDDSILPYFYIGFKTATPEYILRTRIWASLRTQTLYRTISGFMNYSRAIKLLYDIERQNSGPEQPIRTFEQQKRLEEPSIVALRKFRLLVAMQRLKNFDQEELESTEFLLRAYPEIQISYIDEVLNPVTGVLEYFSCLMDGSCEVSANNERLPKYRIKLPGNPILGDGKADNQNHAIIFARGEYIQLVDANQDNYLEECLKIRNIMAEFEEMSEIDYTENVALGSEPENKVPVAIVGTREYIFSENIGILGDVAAGKEQTFGTLSARTLAHIGGKLHYGHPDFLNTIFVTTRGGVSKGQKGLHLNEDIYAGMNAILRGGRIKHCEYMQCGKGRDLGFGSILNFTTKIGSGMGEQMLSREYFYLGTNLPLDRFLSFYYAHPGFHLNNVFIVSSIRLFIAVALNLAILINNSVLCYYDEHKPITEIRKPAGCVNLIPILSWLRRSILSMFVVFFVSFIPLCVQELTERGIWKAFSRIAKHFVSLSPFFEIFVCKIYAGSLVNNLAFGGARYIATGRGFAIVRTPFSSLYSKYAPVSFYFAIILALLLLITSLAAWDFTLLYFWFTLSALLFSPFVFNPNQFLWCEFFIDYKHYLIWLFSGNSSKSKSPETWIQYIRDLRMGITGSKKKNNYLELTSLSRSHYKRPNLTNKIFCHIFPQLIFIIMIFIPYLFISTKNQTKGANPANALIRLMLITFGPIIANATILILGFFFSLFTGPVLSTCMKRYPSFISCIIHIFSLLDHIFFFNILFLLQNWDVTKTLLGFVLSILIQRFVFSITECFLLSREIFTGKANTAWWSGKWLTASLGWHIFSQIFREFLCKIIELSFFACDFLLGHFLLIIQLPILLIPYIDKWHSMMLFWLKPSNQIRPRIVSVKKRKKLRFTVQLYLLVFLIFSIFLFILIFGPVIAVKIIDINTKDYIPENLQFLIQPLEHAGFYDKGLKAYKKMKKKKTMV
ncbi:related to 1,3-beta-glucan synthase component FKS1 [Saccharomycodes ludwigii]|uniref:1,3-beta-glucan synthase n=1 Tax=Saccharomycodes ludwigii TaxID=36035 RepID=A0A376B9T7_9ASCO|nr:related to 1,3-beta-glucan synthase component FKS1 [Saccharomycodes ludwigii]